MGAGYEVEPLLAGNDEPAGRLWGPDHPAQADADLISIEQRRLAVALLGELDHDRADFADRIIRALAPAEAYQTFGLVQGIDSGKLLRMTEIERGGNWKLAGVLALADPANTADVTVALDGLALFPIRVTARRTDPVEATPNVPLRTVDTSFAVTIAGGAAADKLVLYLRLQRTGARLGRGAL